MDGDNRACNGKAKAVAAVFPVPGGFTSVETFENMLLVLCRDSISCIADQKYFLSPWEEREILTVLCSPEYLKALSRRIVTSSVTYQVIVAVSGDFDDLTSNLTAYAYFGDVDAMKNAPDGELTDRRETGNETENS